MDGAVVGAGSLWPTPIRELESRDLFWLLQETEFSALLCIFFPFDQLFRVCLMVIMLLCQLPKAIVAAALLCSKFWWCFWELLSEYQTFGSLLLRFTTQFVSCFFFFFFA
jgi:hypothetical protein